MSAFILHLVRSARPSDSDSIIALTDGGLFNIDKDDENGEYKLVGVASKTRLLPQLNCLLVGQGTGSFLDLLIYNKEQHWRSFDDLLGRIEEDTEWVVHHYRNVYGRNPKRQIGQHIGLAGWSDARERMEIHYLEVLEDGDVINGPHEFGGNTLMSPFPEEKHFERVGLLKNGHVKCNVNLEAGDYEDLCLLMQAQRYCVGPIGFDDVQRYGCCVAAHIEYTHLGRYGALTKIIYRWPDEIGKVVDAEAGPFVKRPQPIANPPKSLPRRLARKADLALARYADGPR